MPMFTIAKVCVAFAGLLAAVSAIPVPNRIPVEFCQEDCCKFGFVCCFDTCVLDRPNTPTLCPLNKSRCCTDPNNDCAAQLPPQAADDPADDGDCKADCCPAGLDCICGGCAVFDGFPVLCDEGSGSCCTDPKNPCATDV